MRENHLASPNEIVEKFGKGSLELQSVPLEGHFSARKAASFLPFPEKSRIPYAPRRPVVEGQAQSGRAVAISGSKFNERTLRPVPRCPWRARVAGTYVYANAYVAAKEHTHVSPARPYVNLRIDQRIVSNVHHVDFAV